MMIKTHLGDVHFGGARSETERWLDVWDSVHPDEPGAAAVVRAKSDVKIGVLKSGVLEEASDEVKRVFEEKLSQADLETLIRTAGDAGLFVRVMVGKLPSPEELE